MSRYLTPSKVSLLALIWLYSTAESEHSGYEQFSQEATIPILSFIIENVLPKRSPGANDPKTGASKNHITLRLNDFEHVLSKHASGSMPGQNCWDIFLKKMWRDFKSFDDLFVFFKTLELDIFELKEEERARIAADARILDRPVIQGCTFTPTSVLGAYVRRAILEFTRLQIDDTIKLWESFVRYRAPTENAWRKRNPNKQNENHFDAVIEGLGLDDNHPLTRKLYKNYHTPLKEEELVSTEDIERSLEYQVEQLQSKHSPTSNFQPTNGLSEYGNRVPQTMKAQFQALLGPQTPMPNLFYFVKYVLMNEQIILAYPYSGSLMLGVRATIMALSIICTDTLTTLCKPEIRRTTNMPSCTKPFCKPISAASVKPLQPCKRRSLQLGKIKT
jgi:anaphase-promoting complex subunit 5